MQNQEVCLLYRDGLLWPIWPLYGCLPVVGLFIIYLLPRGAHRFEILCNDRSNGVERDSELREAFKDMAPDLQDQLTREISYRFASCPAHGTI